MFFNNSSKPYSKEQEKGRSLIEIIAVLVVIAILLIGALVGFRLILDMFKKRETASAISTIALRYKSSRLGRARDVTKGSEQTVSIKDFFPEGDCNAEYCTTPDRGQVSLHASGDTTSFVVVAKDIDFISCQEAMLQSSYDLVTDADLSDAFNEGVINSDGEVKFFTPDDFKKDPVALKKFCKGNTHSFLYNGKEKGDCKHFYSGKCYRCPKGEQEDKNGNCCAHPECGVCGGCGKDVCVNGMCRECDPTKNDSQGLNPNCKANSPSKPYCDKDHKCKECLNSGDVCYNDTGSVSSGLYCSPSEKMCCVTPDCDCEREFGKPPRGEGAKCSPKCGCAYGLTCQDGVCIPVCPGPDPCPGCLNPPCPPVCPGPTPCPGCPNPPCPPTGCPDPHTVGIGESCNGACPDACSEDLTCLNGVCSCNKVCMNWDDVDKKCVCKNKGKVVQKGGSCKADKCPGCPVECATGLVCRSSTETCECPPENSVGEGGSCDNGSCPNSCNEGLDCINHVCVKPESPECPKKGFGTQPRNKNHLCKPTECPCNPEAGDALMCYGSKDNAKCECNSLPTSKNDACWGECGCANSLFLRCSTSGAELGQCECITPLPATEKASCMRACGCGPALECRDNKCECNPPKFSLRIPKGQACAGEEVCPKQCVSGTTCKDGNDTSDASKKCCPPIKGYRCDQKIYDSDGCLEYDLAPCPMPGDSSDKKVCNTMTGRCVECTRHEDCEGNEYCDPSLVCRHCPAPENRCDIDADQLYRTGVYAGRCIEKRKFTCPRPTDDPKKDMCHSSGTYCVECLKPADCEGDTYCGPDHVCLTCPTETCGNMACCALDGTPTDVCGKNTPKSHMESVTYTKMVNGVCRSVTENYCPLTTPTRPSNTCSPCNICQFQNSDGTCSYLDPGAQVVCGNQCCSKACNRSGTGCCQSMSFGNKQIYSDHWKWSDNSTFTVDSQKDMTLSISVASITRCTKIELCEGLDCTNYCSGTNSISKSVPLKAGHTYSISVDLENKCAACNITAICNS